MSPASRRQTSGDSSARTERGASPASHDGRVRAPRGGGGGRAPGAVPQRRRERESRHRGRGRAERRRLRLFRHAGRRGALRHLPGSDADPARFQRAARPSGDDRGLPRPHPPQHALAARGRAGDQGHSRSRDRALLRARGSRHALLGLFDRVWGPSLARPRYSAGMKTIAFLLTLAALATTAFAQHPPPREEWYRALELEDAAADAELILVVRVVEVT